MIIVTIEILAYDEDGAHVVTRVSDALTREEDPKETMARLTAVVAKEINC